MPAIIIILTFLFPIIGIIFSFCGMIFSKKYKLLYSICASLSLATLAYLYVPTSIEDLYRHHLNVLKYTYITNKDFINILLTEIEKIRILIEYIVCKIGNVNLLQFMVTFITYMLIFNIVNKNFNKNDSNFKYALILLFTFFSFSYMSIISNLWYMLAVSIFSLGIYKEYNESKKICAYILYILSILVHSSIIFPLGLLILFKIFKNKINIKLVLFMLILFSSIGIILNFLVVNYNNAIISELYNYYLPYFENAEFISSMHPTRLMIIYLIKLIPYFLIYTFNNKDDSKDIDKLSICYMYAIFILYMFSSFSVRFIPIVQLCGIDILLNCFNQMKNKKYNLVFLLIMTLIGIIWILFHIYQAKYYNFYDINSNLYRDIIYIIGSRG